MPHIPDHTRNSKLIYYNPRTILNGQARVIEGPNVWKVNMEYKGILITIILEWFAVFEVTIITNGRITQYTSSMMSSRQAIRYIESVAESVIQSIDKWKQEEEELQLQNKLDDDLEVGELVDDPVIPKLKKRWI